MRAVVYTRQSLDRGGVGAAVERQREDCEKLCADRGWDLVRVYVDNDVSASSRKARPEFTKMLDALRAGEAEVLVAWHVDRLTRKLTDLENLIELAHETGVRIVTINGDLDLSNDSGRLVGRILASVARGEVERKGARQKRAQQQAAQEGRPAGGRRAFGYESDGMTIVPAEAQRIVEGYAELLTGASLKSIARRWNEAGATTSAGGTWRHDNVREVLKNPRYAGLRAYKGEVVGQATWEALVDEDTHAAAVALLSLPSRRTNTAGTARKHLLPGLAYCWKCGGDVASGYSRHKQRVYVCRDNKCISRKAEPVDELIEAVMIDRLSRPDALELLSRDGGPDLERERGQAEAIRQRLDDLALGLEEGILTLPAVRASSKRLRAELGAIEERIASATRADVLTPLLTSGDAAAAWRRADLAQKRGAIQALMTITLEAPERGHQPFSPESVRIQWKSEA